MRGVVRAKPGLRNGGTSAHADIGQEAPGLVVGRGVLAAAGAIAQGALARRRLDARLGVGRLSVGWGAGRILRCNIGRAAGRDVGRCAEEAAALADVLDPLVLEPAALEIQAVALALVLELLLGARVVG